MKIMVPTSVHPMYSRVPVFRAFPCQGRGSSTSRIESAQNTENTSSRIVGDKRDVERGGHGGLE